MADDFSHKFSMKCFVGYKLKSVIDQITITIWQLTTLFNELSRNRTARGFPKYAPY